MKDLSTAIQDELTRLATKPEAVKFLNLDKKCKATHVTGLEAFSSLESLSLVGIGLTSLEGFPHLPKLTTLNLADNKLTGDLKYLAAAKLDSLRSLILANNRISQLSELEPLKQLRLSSLDLLACPVEDKVPDFSSRIFKMLDELKYLDNYDKNGAERDADEEEDEGDEGAEEEYDEEAGGEGEFEEGDDEDYEEGEGEEGDAPLEDDENEYEDEGEGGEDDEIEEGDEGEEEEEGAQGTKRKRGDEEEEPEEDE